MLFLVLFITHFFHSTFASEPLLKLDFPLIAKQLGVSPKSGICDVGGKRPYQTVVDVPGKNYRLICKVREEKYQYDSETTVNLIENFDYPRNVFADMEKYWEPNRTYPTTKSIHVKKEGWGVSYDWSTETIGSRKYIYLCPKKSESCVRVITGGIETLDLTLSRLR